MFDNYGDYNIVVIIAIGIILFLVLREFNAWYWKINELVDKLTDISNTLKNIDLKLDNETKDYEVKDDKTVSRLFADIDNDEYKNTTENDIIKSSTVKEEDIRTAAQKIKDMLNKDLV